MGEVIHLNNTPESILTGALDADLTSAMVVGFDGGGRFYIAASSANAAELLLALELAKGEVLSHILGTEH